MAGRLGSYSGGLPAAGYAAELLSSGQVKLWRLSDWAQLGTYTISGLQAGQWVTLGLRLNGSSLSVEIDGVTRITATDSTFSSGEVGLWSYQPTAANQHIFDDFLVQNLGQGYIPGSKVRAVENTLVKIAHRGNELRKAQLLQAPPAGHAWTSYYFTGSVRIAMREQVNGSTDQVFYLLTDHLGSTTVSYRADGGETRYQQYYPWGALRPGPGTSLPTDRTYTGQRWDSYINMVWYGSRWYDSELGRFIQPDSIVPGIGERGNPNAVGYLGASTYSPVTIDYHENQLLDQLNQENRTKLQNPNFRLPSVPTNPIAFDRYAYSLNNPIRYVDPSGHFAILAALALITPVGWVAIGVTAIGVGLYFAVPGVREAVTDGIYQIAEAATEKPDTTKPGPYAGDSIEARNPDRDFTEEEREAIDAIGQATGCHSCGTTNPGTKSGHFIPDHQPPNALNPSNSPQRLYPHCLSCSRTQGGQIAEALRRR